MKLNSKTYYTPAANMRYFSVSQFKDFEKCEACALAEAEGRYRRPDTTALLVGSYVDAYFTDSIEELIGEAPEAYLTKKGELRSDFRKAEEMIERIQQDAMMSDFLDIDTHETQVIRTGELFGYPWKIRMDFVNDEHIVDLKTVKDFGDVYDPAYGRRDWISLWGYDLQGAIYQLIEEQATGIKKPFYLAAVTKQDPPDIALIQLPQYVLDAAIKAHGVEERIERFAMIKSGEVEPRRCENCAYCRKTKVIDAPAVYEPSEA